MKKGVLFLIALLVVVGTLWGALDGIHPFGEVGKAPMDDYQQSDQKQHAFFHLRPPPPPLRKTLHPLSAII